MTARLFLTVYAADDLPTEEAHIASKSLGTVTSCTELAFTKHLHGSDELNLKISRHHPDAALLIADRYVIVHSDIGPVGGAFLEQAPIDLSAAEGPGDEWIEWIGCRGPISVLERVVMDMDSNLSGGQDPIKGFWDLSNQGNFAGASNGHPIPMMKRVLEEVELNPPNGIPMVDHSSWDYDLDTDSQTPPFWGEIVWGADIGDDGLQLAAEMSQLGSVVWHMSHLFKFDAYLAFGTDRTGAFGAAGKVRFEKGVNIADAIRRTVRGSVLRTHLVVGGMDRTYVKVADPDYSPGDVVRWGFLAVPETADPAALREAGLAHIAARKRQTDVWSFPQHDHGDSIADGIYEPGPPGTSGTHYWVGDSPTLHSGTGPYDANELAVPISAITWQLKTGDEANGDYWVIPQVGATFDWPPGNAGEHHVPPAPPAQGTAASCDLSPSQMTEVPTPNGGFEDGNTTGWTAPGGSIAAITTDPQAGTYNGNLSGAGQAVYQNFSSGFTFKAGTPYVARVYRRGTDPQILRFGDFVSDMSDTPMVPVGEWTLACGVWTPASDITGDLVGVRLRNDVGLDNFEVDSLQVYVGGAADTTQPIGGGGDGTPGDPGVYAPLGHIHEHGDQADHDDETHHHASSVEVTPFSTIAATDVQAALEEIFAEADGGTDDQTAAEVPFTPAGTIAATDTQAAVEEVATDAAAVLAAHAADTDLHGGGSSSGGGGLPLTAVVDGEPVLVWDENLSLIDSGSGVGGSHDHDADYEPLGEVATHEAAGHDGAIVGDSGHEYRVIAGVLRKTSGVWSILDDAGHTPVGLSGISANSTRIQLTYAFTAVTVSAVAVTVDETWAATYRVGASVGLSTMDIYMKDLDGVAVDPTGVSDNASANIWVKGLMEI